MLMATEATGSAEMERGAKHMNLSMRMSCHTVYRNYRIYGNIRNSSLNFFAFDST